VGELLALSEALVVAIHELADRSKQVVERGKVVVVRIFNDNKYNLEYLQGIRSLDKGLLTMAQPVLDLIAMQSWHSDKWGCRSFSSSTGYQGMVITSTRINGPTSWR
jgi:hypothetical protein